jgi:hypothetical protein
VDECKPLITGCAQLVTLSMHGCPIRQDMMEVGTYTRPLLSST